MTKSVQLSLAGVTLAAAIASSGGAVAAETHVIGVQGIAWTYKDKKSTPTTPLAADDLKIGDIIEFSISGGIPHGVVTIKRPAGAPPVEDKSFVLACGEDAKDKPNAVLRETECGAASKFGVVITGSMKMEVLSTFKDPVDFFCVVHRNGMAGQFKLAP